MNRPFTGRDALLVIGGGFLVVIAVNLALAVNATRSHPGLVVDNSYVASQKFNGWLAQGRAQKAMGWTVDAQADAARLSVDARGPDGQPISGLHVMATLGHPLGADPSRDVLLLEQTPGIYSAPHGLRPGQWRTEIRLTGGQASYYLSERLVVPG